MVCSCCAGDCSGGCKTWLQGLFITKKYNAEELHRTDLQRALSLLDLIALGAFATLGVGLYVLAGVVARQMAGPAAILSFACAAFCSILSGICYAEFGGRVPRAGSAYVYTYVTIGESVAFVIGWSLILEYVIGVASVGRALIHYIDSLPIIDYKWEKLMLASMPMKASFLADYPDFLAFTVVMVLTTLIAFGVKQTAYLNNAFSVVNLLTILLVIIAGSFLAKPGNWNISKADIPELVRNQTDDTSPDGGEGGFFPYGFQGVMSGAAEAFYAFVGFDTLATCGEEAKNPKNIPRAIVASLAIVSCAYFGVCTVLTMMVPYYDQHVKSPLPYAFQQADQPVIAWIVTLGAIFALCTSMVGAMFPMPRIVYSMASDGLIFKYLARVNSWTQTPVVATYTVGFLAATMACMFNLETLVEMMSIGTLGAYSIVTACVMILRYEHPDMNELNYPGDAEPKVAGFLDKMFNTSKRKYPSASSSAFTKLVISIFCVLEIVLCLFFTFCYDLIVTLDPVILTLTAVLLIVILFLLVVLCFQPTATAHLTFTVPLVPWTTAVSVIINTYLMMMLSLNTWIRFTVWMITGFIIYFTYGLSHSVEAIRRKGQ